MAGLTSNPLAARLRTDARRSFSPCESRLHFSSMATLQAAVASPSAQKVVAHAIAISSGGLPVVLVAEEETKGLLTAARRLPG